ISLALVYMEIARRAGLYVEGINFPGHFLLRCPARRGMSYTEDLIIDAHHGGALLSQDACRSLAEKYTEPEEVQGSGFKVQGSGFKVQGSGGDDDSDDDETDFDDAPPEIDRHLLVRAAKPQILARMLVNLKRIYVR